MRLSWEVDELADSWGNSTETLIGLTAGHICYWDLQPRDWLEEAISEAAAALWERLMSPWVLTAILQNGTTIWESPDGSRTAAVDASGRVSVAGTG